MKSPPKTSCINGLVGLLTQALNHDCESNNAWVPALTAARLRCQRTLSAIHVVGF